MCASLKVNLNTGETSYSTPFGSSGGGSTTQSAAADSAGSVVSQAGSAALNFLNQLRRRAGFGANLQSTEQTRAAGAGTIMSASRALLLGN